MTKREEERKLQCDIKGHIPVEDSKASSFADMVKEIQIHCKRCGTRLYA